MTKASPKSGRYPEGGLHHEILTIFHGRGEDEVVSGEELSGLLHISRTAVWKHIKTLKEMGYAITAEPSRGYRLAGAPDLLIPEEVGRELSVTRLGTRIVSFRETDSTNDVAFRLAEDGAEEGTVVLADAQTKGKGRLGREWASPPAVNLYCSLILRPPLPPYAAPQLTFLSAVAVARAIEENSCLLPRIKWPNDLLINDRKVAGLLNEMSAETDHVNFVILGIGVNLNMAQDQFPTGLRHPATSLFIESGSRVSRTRFTRSLLKSLDSLYDTYLKAGDAPIREEWLVRSRMAGEQVRVVQQDVELVGRVTGIDGFGALLVTDGRGEEHRVLSGDVKIL